MATALGAPLSKAEELHLFESLVEQLPDGYIRDILTEATPFIESAMRSDIATHQPISGIMHARSEAMDALTEVTKKVSEKSQELHNLQREFNRLSSQLSDVKSDIRSLAAATR